MTLLCKFTSKRYEGQFEINRLYHTLTANHDLYEVRYRHTGGGNGFAPASELFLCDPDLERLTVRLLELDPTLESAS